jgi:hypothetical protein
MIGYRFDENNNVVRRFAFRKHGISAKLDDSRGKRRCEMQTHFAAPRPTTHPDTIITLPDVTHLEFWGGLVVLRSLFSVKTTKAAASTGDDRTSRWCDDPSASRGM